MFMFAIVGILYYKSIDDDPSAIVLGLPNRWWCCATSSGSGSRAGRTVPAASPSVVACGGGWQVDGWILPG
jgi:hypothetical protein